MIANPGKPYTLGKAAAATGLSVRALRRRIKEGKVSAPKGRRGEQNIWLIDPAELARYAEATGQRLTLPADEA